MFTAISAPPAHRAAPAALNIDLVFPIRDEISAWLMCLKAELLYDAGIINGNELDAVIERAAAAIGRPKITVTYPMAAGDVPDGPWMGRAVPLIKEQSGVEGVFQPEDLRALGAAFDEAWEELEKSGLYFETDYQPQRVRNTLGKYIIEEAKKGQRDIVRLRDSALLLYRSYEKPPAPANRPPQPPQSVKPKRMQFQPDASSPRLF